MAQTAGILVLRHIEDRRNKLVLLVSVDAARFRKPVVPGDQLRFEMTVIKRKATVAKMAGKAYVDGALVAEAELMCKIEDRPPDAPAAVAPPASELAR
jgi:3-hydroxymyristoyl/3-hydroxydecanoyl-(acyl carrier protein) dehydratase